MLKNTNKITKKSKKNTKISKTNTKISKKNKLEKKRIIKKSKKNGLKNIKNKTRYLKGGARHSLGSSIDVDNIIKFLNDIETKISKLDINNKSTIDDVRLLIAKIISLIDDKHIKEYEIDILIENIKTFISSIMDYKKDTNKQLNNISIESINKLKTDIEYQINFIIIKLNSKKELRKLENKNLLESRTPSLKNTLRIPKIPYKQELPELPKLHKLPSKQKLPSRPSRESINSVNELIPPSIIRKYSLPNAKDTNYTPLDNVGNSCYMNSAIQLLFAIPDFRQIIKEQVSDSNEIDALKLLVEYFEGGHEYVRGNILDIDDIKKKLSAFINSSNNNNMRKAKQISLESKLKNQTIYNKLYLDPKYGQIDTNEFILRKIFGSIDKNPLFNELFGFRPDEEIICNNGFKSKIIHPPEHYEKTIQIELYNEVEKQDLIELIINKFNINNFKTLNLQDCINQLYNPEFYSDDNQPNRCKDRGSLFGNSKRIVNYNTKKYIIFYIRRFLSYKKSNESVTDPTHTQKLNFELDPNAVINIDKDIKAYKLKSCIIHIGKTSNSGHYIYLNFDEHGRPLHIIDDGRVYPYDGEKNNDHNYKTGLIYLYELIE
jgi:hypothetical protein